MTQTLKKTIYIISFTVLGILFGILVSSFGELLRQQYNPALIIGISVICGALGVWSGFYWWKQIYVLHRLKNLPNKNKWFIEVIIFLLAVGGTVWFATQQPTLTTPISTINQQVQTTSMKISSPNFAANGDIPKIYTCQGQGINPELDFSGVPTTAKSLALVLHDPDAPMPGGFTHWVVFNMSPETMSIPENSKPPGVQAKNGAGQNAYIGPCPPSGTHHYHFMLYALDIELNASQVTDQASLESAMETHIVAQTEVIGLFSK